MQADKCNILWGTYEYDQMPFFRTGTMQIKASEFTITES